MFIRQGGVVAMGGGRDAGVLLTHQVIKGFPQTIADVYNLDGMTGLVFLISSKTELT